MCSKKPIQKFVRAWMPTAIFFCPLLVQLSSAQGPATSQDAADPHAQHQGRTPAPKTEGDTIPAPDQHDMANMPGMDHGQMPGTTHAEHSNDAAGAYLMSLASGTSMNPRSAAMPMLMPRLGSWNLMIMGQAFLVDTQQSGPRGGDKLYAPNWFMLSAEHRLGRGSFLFQSMFSLEPATVTNRSYPLLFQTGETAYGKALVDAQHPHDSFMGLGVHYARPLGEGTIIHAYYAPIGDPALGPVAFPHRASAAELPEATLAHHLQDSTHIASNVATIAVEHKWLRLEASGFYGTEPNENRWNIEWGPMNSYSGRISVSPSKNWMAQFSAGRLKDPERPVDGAHGEPGYDVVRTTASLHYSRPNGNENAWSASLIWGRNHNSVTERNTNSYLLEILYPVARRNFLTARVELVDKDELFANTPALEDQLARTAGTSFRIQAYTAGYTRDIGTFRNVETGLGGVVSAYHIPAAIQPYYGDHPWGASIFLRFRLKSTGR